MIVEIFVRNCFHNSAEEKANIPEISCFVSLAIVSVRMVNITADKQ